MTKFFISDTVRQLTANFWVLSMQTGRRYYGHFSGQESKEGFLTWSAAQMLVYNAKVQENEYFWSFHQKFWCPEALPKPDQKFSHLINHSTYEWLAAVPSLIFRNGCVIWYRAMCSFLRGVTKKPRCKRIRGSDRSLWLTRELFTIEPDKKAGFYVLRIGTRTKALGSIRFKAHQDFQMPASVTVRMQAGRVYVSFCFEEAADAYAETEDEIAARLQMLTAEELAEQTVGVDRGVKRLVQCSNGVVYNFTPIQQSRMREKEKKRRRYQRMLSRRKPGSQNWHKAKARLSRIQKYATNVRQDFAHQTSHALVKNNNTQLIVFEELKIKNMTKAPEPKINEETGAYEHNGARAKAGLNKSILESAWGRVLQYSQYKAVKAGKLVITVPPEYSSQTCAQCGYVDKGNRLTQAVFRCLHCGHQNNADLNASLVLRDRGVRQLLESGLKKKSIKKTLRLKKSKGAGMVQGTGTCLLPVEHKASADGDMSLSQLCEIPVVESHNRKEAGKSVCEDRSPASSAGRDFTF